MKLWMTPKVSRVSKANLPFLAILLLLVLPLSVPAQRREHSVDSWRPLHYDVAVAFNDQITEVTTARTEITLQIIKPDLTSIELDFGDMPIDSVSVAGVPARFERKPELLNVVLARAAKPGDILDITVNY